MYISGKLLFWLILIFIILICSLISSLRSLSKHEKLDFKKRRIDTEREEVKRLHAENVAFRASVRKEEKEKFSKLYSDLRSTYQQKDLEFQLRQQNFRKKEAHLNHIISEKQQSYPWLSAFIAEYQEFLSQKSADELLYKSRPAPTAAFEVKRFGREKKALALRLKLTEHQLHVYESTFPWLLEFKELTPEEISIAAASHTEQSDNDESTVLRRWLSDIDYSNLPSCEKYQLALDRYKSYPRSAWEAGIAYERYIGYLYEQSGAAVTYNGAISGLNDMGRDLVVLSDDQHILVQCKRYSKEKFVHENTVFQLYGSLVLYRIYHPNAKCTAAIYSTSPLSLVAQKCADFLEIEVHESFPLQDYPMIKCNISSDGSRIYHLPFDQQYDRVVIDTKKGERFVSTVQEAEELGFRRAYRWHSS